MADNTHDVALGPTDSTSAATRHDLPTPVGPCSTSGSGWPAHPPVYRDCTRSSQAKQAARFSEKRKKGGCEHIEGPAVPDLDGGLSWPISCKLKPLKELRRHGATPRRPFFFSSLYGICLLTYRRMMRCKLFINTDLCPVFRARWGQKTAHAGDALSRRFLAPRGNARSAPARPRSHLPAGEEVMARKWKRDFSSRVCKSMSYRRLCISTSSACLQHFLAEGCVWGVLG